MSEQDMLQDLLGDEYLLNWVVGNGGMSTVWLADDIENEREVAVKVLRPEFSDNVEFLSRFRNEALASEDIRNDNVVETYNYKEVTDDSGRTFCFIVMEFIRGESLADMLIRKGSLLEPDALDILEQAAHGLAAIHERGLVHRDIKPGNLLITQNGKVKITLVSPRPRPPHRSPAPAWWWAPPNTCPRSKPRAKTSPPPPTCIPWGWSATKCWPASGRSLEIPPCRWPLRTSTRHPRPCLRRLAPPPGNSLVLRSVKSQSTGTPMGRNWKKPWQRPG